MKVKVKVRSVRRYRAEEEFLVIRLPTCNLLPLNLTPQLQFSQRQSQSVKFNLSPAVSPTFNYSDNFTLRPKFQFVDSTKSSPSDVISEISESPSDFESEKSPKPKNVRKRKLRIIIPQRDVKAGVTSVYDDSTTTCDSSPEVESVNSPSSCHTSDHLHPRSYKLSSSSNGSPSHRGLSPISGLSPIFSLSSTFESKSTVALRPSSLNLKPNSTQRLKPRTLETMSTFGTAAEHVARRARSRQDLRSRDQSRSRDHTPSRDTVRSRDNTKSRDYDSDGSQSNNSRTKNQRPTSAISRARSQSPKSQSPNPRSESPSAASKVFSSSTLPSPNTQNPLSVWQPTSLPRNIASLPRNGASSGARSSSGRSSPIQVVNHPLVDSGHQVTSRPRTSSTPSHLNQKKRPGRTEEDYLAYLGVHLDRDDNHYYSPGETIQGKIVLKLKHRVFIAGLDFRLKGKIDVLLYSGDTSHKDSETFLYHCHRMIGVWDQRATQLEPGNYVSHFKYILPSRLPNSVTKFSSCQLRVAYGIQAILTDSNKETKQVSKVFLVHSPPEQVTRTPVFHTESSDETEINLQIDSSNLIIGQPCVISVDSKLRISQIYAYLEQVMITGPHRVSEILNKFKSKGQQKLTHDEGQTHTIRIMIPESAMLDIRRFTRAVSVEQNLHVKVKHKDTWFHYSVPVKLYPGTSQFGDDMPRFQRVKRYPTLDTTEQNGNSPVRVKVGVETDSWLDKFSRLFKTD